MKTSSKKIMKNILTASALLALTMTGTATFAQSAKATATASVTETPLKLKIEETKSLQFKLVVENPEHQKVNIILEDNDQNVLFTEYSVVDSKYSKSFDLTGVADGTYSFVVNGRKDKVKQSFEIITKTNRQVLAKNEK